MNICDPLYSDPELARQHIERLHWPHGPVCPTCGSLDRITKLQGKSTRPGVYKCNDCEKPFTVTVGTVMEDSKLPLNKWLMAFALMSAGKKGVSAHQLGRMLGITYKSAWFLAHRIREAMDSGDGPLGGEPTDIIEADETYVGGKARNRLSAMRSGLAPKKNIVVTLVQRGGQARSFHVANVDGPTIRTVLFKNADRLSTLMTDEAKVYAKAGDAYWSHKTVNHKALEYARGNWHTNSAENFFSIFKRGVIGTYHHLSEAHLHRYCREFDFRYNTRQMTDAERAAVAVQGGRGKRLFYRQPSSIAA
jgi:transposase-like protein